VVSNAANAEPAYIELLRREAAVGGLKLRFAQNAVELYSSVDLIVVAPNYPESQGLTPLEALALSVPAVVVASGGLAENADIPGICTVTQDLIMPPACSVASDGSSFPFHYRAALSTAIAAVLRDFEAWRARARLGSKQVLRTYSPKVVIASLEKIYGEVRIRCDSSE
jgi:glycosyltransferase involved in cell wall biosynthesis